MIFSLVVFNLLMPPSTAFAQSVLTHPFFKDQHEVLEVEADQNKNLIAMSWVEVMQGGFHLLSPMDHTVTNCGISVSTDGGGHWTTPIYHLRAGVSNAFNPHVVVTTNNEIFAVCMATADNYESGFIEITKSTDQGKTWLPWKTIAEVQHGIPDKPTIAYSNGRLTLTYSKIDLTDYGMQCRMKIVESYDGGATWTESKIPEFKRTIKTIDPSHFNIEGDNTIYASGSRLGQVTYLLWGEYKGDVYGGIWFATKRPDGRFTPSIKLSEEQMDPPLVSLYHSPDERHLLAVWYNAHGRIEPLVSGRVSHDGGRTWGPKIVFTSKGFNIAGLIDNTGSFTVSYTQFDEATRRGQNLITHFDANGPSSRVISTFDFDINNFSYIGNTHALLLLPEQQSYLWIGMNWIQGLSHLFLGLIH